MRQPSEDEIKALEAEMEKLTVDDVLVQTVVTLLNLGARKAGLAAGTTADLPQVKLAIDAARALLPLLEPAHGEQLAPVREALSRLRRPRPSSRPSSRPTRKGRGRRRAPAGSGFRGNERLEPLQTISCARSSGGPAGLPLACPSGSAGRAARFIDPEGFL
jgi:hypothetical protein